MTSICGTAPKARALSVTDILNEPIAEDGLQARFEITTDKILVGAARSATDYVLAEALGPVAQIIELARAAEGTVESTDDSNVLDFRTGKPVKSSSGLKWEVVYDAAPNRYSTGFAILELSGSRAQVERLSAEATRIFA
ncbi:MAG: hypothetical protein K2Z80_37500 [Xanthobacteraceae bacterium]|nr:hypothetical protein [Xanthobacteraceae bacterium]